MRIARHVYIAFGVFVLLIFIIGILTDFPLDFIDTDSYVQVYENFKRNGPCNVTSFIREFSDTQIPLTSSLVEQLSGCRHVLYTRTPKSGSRGVRDVFEILGERYNFSTPTIPGSDLRKVSLSDDHSMDHNGVVITTHHAYDDFTNLTETEPVLLNVIRDPIAHTISVFSYMKYGSKVMDNPHKERTGINMTLNACLAKYGVQDPCIKDGYTALRYFCGGGYPCRKQTLNRLQQAKTNLSTRYLVVGLTEQLEEFLEVLESTLPRLFFNATQVYTDRLAVALDSWSTTYKEELNDKSLKLLQKELVYDYHFYYFAKARLLDQLLKVRKFKSA